MASLNVAEEEMKVVGQVVSVVDSRMEGRVPLSPVRINTPPVNVLLNSSNDVRSGQAFMVVIRGLAQVGFSAS